MVLHHAAARPRLAQRVAPAILAGIVHEQSYEVLRLGDSIPNPLDRSSVLTSMVPRHNPREQTRHRQHHHPRHAQR